MTLPVVCAGDTEPFGDCPGPHYGGHIATIPPGNLNPILRVRGNVVICRGQPFPGHETATAGTLSPPHPVLMVREIPICLQGDRSAQNCHASGGISTKQAILRAKA